MGIKELTLIHKVAPIPKSSAVPVMASALPVIVSKKGPFEGIPLRVGLLRVSLG